MDLVFSQLKYVLGHKNPDTDCTCSSIGLAYFLDYEPLAVGELNPETNFVLNNFHIQCPKILCEIPVSSVYLVDHSDSKQAIKGIENSKIVGVIDHHMIGDIASISRRVFIYVCKPFGSTCSIISELYFMKSLDYIGAKNKDLPSDIAGALLSGILSDTLLFKSPTTMDIDKSLAYKLADISCIKDVYEYGTEMLKVKSSIASLSPERILEVDCKVFDLYSHKISISQIELFGDVLLETKIQHLKNLLLTKVISDSLELAMLVITNIITENSDILVFGDIKILEKAFGVNVKDNRVLLKGVVSRKKQILPKLEDVFRNKTIFFKNENK